jgi:hypothetical protein
VLVLLLPLGLSLRLIQQILLLPLVEKLPLPLLVLLFL